MENKGSLLRCIPAMMLVIAGHFYWRRLSTVFPTISSCQFECCIANYSFFKIYLIGAAAVVSHRFLLVFTIIFFLLVFFFIFCYWYLLFLFSFFFFCCLISSTSLWLLLLLLLPLWLWLLSSYVFLLFASIVLPFIDDMNNRLSGGKVPLLYCCC